MTTCASVPTAETTRRRLCRRLLRRGYRPGHESASHLASLRASPEDSPTLRSYADWLRQHGDLRAELIEAQLEDASEANARFRDLLAKGEELFALPTWQGVFRLRWRAGFICEVEILLAQLGYAHFPLLRSLFWHPSATLLRAIRVVGPMVSFNAIESGLMELAPDELDVIELRLTRHRGPWLHDRQETEDEQPQPEVEQRIRGRMHARFRSLRECAVEFR